MSIENKLITIANNQTKIKQAGYDEYYNMFWDDFQQNGALTSYICAFGGQWTEKTFKPKYQIKPINAYMLFYNNQGQACRITDFVEFADNLAKEQGKTIEKNPELFDENGHYQLIDFSNCIDAPYAFACLRSTHFGVLDFSKCTGNNSLNYLFYSHQSAVDGVRKIDKMICSVDTAFVVTVSSAGTFNNATKLTEITIGGTIGKSINFGTCPLNKASIESVINALSTSVTGQTATFKKTAVESAFTEAEWENLIATKNNWTISKA